MFRYSLSAALLCIGLSAVPGVGQEAGQPLPAGPVPRERLQPLLDELLIANPELRALRSRLEALQVRPLREQALPDPRITVGWISNGSPLPGAGLGTMPTSNIGFQIAQELPYPGKRELRGNVARADASAEGHLYRARELALTAGLKSRFAELRFVTEAEQVVVRNRALVKKLGQLAEIRYSVGKGTQQDLFRSEVESAALEGQSLQLASRRERLIVEILSLLGRPPGGALARPEEAPAPGPLPDLDSLERQALQESPLLAAQRVAIDGRQAGVQLARRDYAPDFDLMGGYYNQGHMADMWEFKLQFNLPIRPGRNQRYGMEEAVSRLSEARNSYRTVEQELLARLRDYYIAAGTALKLMRLNTERLVPGVQLTLESSLLNYESGTLDFLSVFSNITNLLEFEMNFCEQRSEYFKAVASLEELTGKAIASRTLSGSRTGEK